MDEAQEEGETQNSTSEPKKSMEASVQGGTNQISAEVLDWGQRNDVRLLDVKRHYAGVSSYSALRYLVLWDNGEDGDTDDRITQLES